MLIKSKRKLGSRMNWWFENVYFSLVIVCAVLLASEHRVKAQTYCEDKPKILFYRRGQAALVSGGDTNESKNHVVVSNVNKEFLACVSSRNVEWTYEGDGEPSKFQESSTVDIQKYEDGSISYCLTSQITFSNKQSDTELSRHTGSYSCREIGNISNAVSVYVFASRKNSPTFLQSRKTIMLPLSNENITSYPVLNTPNSITSKNTDGDATGGTTQVISIPCLTTHPNVTVNLMKKDKSNKFVVYSRGIVFDPKIGFIVNASRKDTEDLVEFYGEYKCVSRSSRRGHSLLGAEPSNSKMNVEDFVFITIVKAKSFQVYPPVQEVYTAGMLNLTCESEEPVIMKEVLPSSAQDVYSYLDDDDYGRDRSDDIVETTERTDQKSHIANYMEIAPAPGRSGEIQCLTEKDGKILHTWKYRILRKRAEKLSGIKFNKREKSFTCKSKLGSPGRLSFVSCRTPSECRINRICLSKSENCRGYSNSTRAFCERKSHFCGKIFYKGGSGLIRCIGEGIDEIRGFTDEASTDHAVRMGFGKLKASETALLQLSGIGVKSNSEGQLGQLKKQQVQNENGKVARPSQIYEGDQVNVTLQMGYYYFLYPVQWAIKFKNGSTAQITPDSQLLQVEKLSRTVQASLTLPYTSATTFLKYKTSGNGTSNNSTGSVDVPSQPSEIIALHALMPLRASVDPSWKTISLALTVYGKKDVPQPSTDVESEELLAEQSLRDQPNVNASFPTGSDTISNVTLPKGNEGVQTVDPVSDIDENDDEDAEEEADDDQEQPVINIPKISAININGTNERVGEIIKNNTIAANADKLPENEDLPATKNDEKSSVVEDANIAIEKEVEATTTENIPTNSVQIIETHNESNVTQPEVKVDTANILKPSSSLEKDLSGTQVSTNNAPNPITDATSRDTKVKEANDDTEWMIVEKNQADETLFLARSGLLFDDKDLSRPDSENIDNENDSTNRDDIVVTTELSSVDVANDDDDNIVTNGAPFDTKIETTTATTLLLDDSQ